MAKALFGYVGGPDHRLVDEVRRLRRHVVDLEMQVSRLQSRCDELEAMESARHALDVDVLALTLADVREPAGAR